MNEVHAKGDEVDSYEYNYEAIRGLLRGMDNETSDYMDKAINIVKDIYQEYLNVDGNRIKIIALLEKIGEADDGFTFNVAYNKKGSVTGIVWMTAVMRSNLERFCSFISLDAMKRTTNVQMWP